MITLSVDDQQDVTLLMKRMLTRIDPNGTHMTASNMNEALEKLSDRVQILFLDIEMPGLNGIEAADMLKNKYKRLNVVFVTGHPEYSLAAHGVHPSGFLSKPIDEDDICRELENLRYPISKEPIITVQCKPFAIFIGGEPFDFTSVQTKELFAYLVYKSGAICSNEELLDVFFGGDLNKKGRLRQLVMDMRNTIEASGSYGLFVKKYGRIGVDPNAVNVVGDLEDIGRFFIFEN